MLTVEAEKARLKARLELAQDRGQTFACYPAPPSRWLEEILNAASALGWEFRCEVTGHPDPLEGSAYNQIVFRYSPR